MTIPLRIPREKITYFEQLILFLFCYRQSMNSTTTEPQLNKLKFESVSYHEFISIPPSEHFLDLKINHGPTVRSLSSSSSPLLPSSSSGTKLKKQLLDLSSTKNSIRNSYLSYFQSDSKKFHRINYLKPTEFVDSTSILEDRTNTSVHMAAFKGAYSSLQMQGKKSSVNLVNAKKQTPLHFAMFCASATIAEMLLDFGANQKTVDINGDTPLMIACKLGKEEHVRALLEYQKGKLAGSKVKKIKGMVRRLTRMEGNEKVKDLNMKNLSGVTPWLVACVEGNMKIVNLLMENGAKFDVKDAQGNTPLMVASSNGHLQLVEKIFDFAAAAKVELNPVKYGNKKKWTALHFAAANGEAEIVKILLAKGADVNAVTDDLDTPCSLAFANKHFEAFEVLIMHGGKAMWEPAAKELSKEELRQKALTTRLWNREDLMAMDFPCEKQIKDAALKQQNLQSIKLWPATVGINSHVMHS
jgi:ankyrin repeat protein